MSSKIPGGGSGDKPSKPHPDFPLTAHPNGQWSKKIRGKVHYFGVWADPDAALAEFLRVKDALLAGHAIDRGEGSTVADLCNDFLGYKEAMLKSGEITPRTFSDYVRASRRLTEYVGRELSLSCLTPQVLADFRDSLAGQMGPVSLGNEITRIRVVLKYAYDGGLVDSPIRYGLLFRPPAKRILRRDRQAKPLRLFKAKEVRQLLDEVSGQMRAMVLLGVNCAFGNTDCATVPQAAFDLDGGWVSFPRPKTQVERRAPLWAETIAALQSVKRRPVREKEDRGLMFLTSGGRRWVRTKPSPTHPDQFTVIDSVSRQFGKACRMLDLPPGRNFYALRHTFETIGGELGQQIAVDFLMGHAPASGDMSAHYREHISDERLLAVTDHLRKWLFGLKC